MPRSMTIVPARRLCRLRYLCRPGSFCQLAIASTDGSRSRSPCPSPHARRAHRILAVAAAESNLFAIACFPASLTARARVVTHPTLPARLDSHYDPPSHRKWGSILRCASFMLLAWPGSVSRGEMIMRGRAEVQSSLTAVVGGLPSSSCGVAISSHPSSAAGLAARLARNKPTCTASPGERVRLGPLRR